MAIEKESAAKKTSKTAIVTPRLGTMVRVPDSREDDETWKTSNQFGVIVCSQLYLAMTGILEP
jgi:hypothetical protein